MKRRQKSNDWAIRLMMAFSADTKRFSGLLLAILVLAAFIGPACALLPDSAMAMPVDGELVPCGDSGTVMEACPLDRPLSGAPSTAPIADVQAVLFVTAEPLAETDSWDLVASRMTLAGESPPSHLTPLRL
jgi:hypothetical protein